MVRPPPPPPAHTSTTKQGSPRWTNKLVNGYTMPMASEYIPGWVEVLREAKYPTTVLTLDFEAYFDSDYSLSKLTNPEYITDKRFEVTGLGSLVMQGNAPFSDYEAATQFQVGEQASESHLRYYQKGLGVNFDSVTVAMHNAPFDAMILALRYGIYPKYIIDTKSLALAWNTRTKNDLGHLTERFNLPLKSKDETKTFDGVTFRRNRYLKPSGRGKHRKPPTPRPVATDEQIAALVAYGSNDVARQWEVFTILLPRFSNPATELRIQQHTLELFTKPVLRVDKARGEELVVGMNQEVEKILIPTGMSREEISGDKSFEWALSEAIREVGENPQQYMKVCKTTAARPGGMMLALAKDDKERKILAGHASEKIRNLMAARGAIDSWPLHINRVQRILRMAACCGGLLPVPLTYWGAHTGRWTGGQKINLQNLPKRGHLLVTSMRGLLIAPEGYVLCIVDLAAIEARVLAWIAGQWDLVDKFAKNEEIYCGFAAKVLGRPVRKPIKEGKPGYIKAIEEKHTWARNSIGKIGILGCGYGMGHKDPADPEKPNYLFADAGLDFHTAQRIVGVYRESHKEITGFWRAIEKAFCYTAKYRKPCTMERGLRFSSTEEVDVVITLPNDRELHYHKVRVTPGDYGNDQIRVFNGVEQTWEYIWGGGLTENVVQAMSRDVLIEAAMRLEDKGYHTAHTVHDELILCVPQAQGQECLNASVKELSREPVWAPRLALGAEGLVTERYGTH